MVRYIALVRNDPRRLILCCALSLPTLLGRLSLYGTQHGSRYLRLLVIALLWSEMFSVEPAISAPARERKYESPRAHGRGGTFVAAQESDDASFMNPATLSEDHKKTFQMRWLNLDLMFGQNTVDTISYILNIAGTSPSSPVALLQNFSDKFGKQQYTKIQASGFGVRFLNFDIAPFFSTTNWLDMRVPTTPEMRIFSNTMAGANISFATAIGSHLHVGVTARPFFRSLFDVHLQFAEVMEFQPMGEKDSSDVFKLRTGIGVGFDIGTLYKIGKSTRLGFTIEDIGRTGYMLTAESEQADTPPSIAPNVSLGLQSRIDVGSSWNVDWAVDLQDLMNPDELNAMRLLHLGAELGRSYRTQDHDMGLTAGLNEGFVTFGGFVDLWLIRLDLVSYAVELGETPGQRQDRRYGVSAKTSLIF